MSLTLYYHPLSSYCQKALIGLYENDTPFVPQLVDLMNETTREEYKKIWPLGKFPVLRDAAQDRLVPEASIIIEYLAQHYPGRSALIPADPDLARQMRMRDRFFDLYVNDQVGKIVTDRLRPTGQSDPYGVEQAKAMLHTALGMIEKDVAGKTWVMGDSFTMADCAAAPALFYANLLMPFGDRYKNAAAYLGRLLERPSFARAVREAQPYLQNMPS
jgi:glutathione S-transferase